MTVSGQFSCPPPGNFVAVSGQFLVAADTSTYHLSDTPRWHESGAVRDRKTLTLQANRAKAVIAGEKVSRTPRFVKTTGGDRVLDQASLERAHRLAGLKGYVTNIPLEVMPPVRSSPTTTRCGRSKPPSG